MKRLALFTMATALLAAPAIALDDEPYVEAGRRLAEANCAQCHNIEPGGAFKLYPPSFQAIGAYWTPDIIQMKIMYQDHAVIMPRFERYMFVENVNNIVGYILSLQEDAE